MKTCIRYVIAIVLLTSSSHLYSQDITGTWEGSMGNDQFLQVNIIQVGDKLCGYSWDHLNDNPRSYCMANFSGRLDKRKNEWILTGYSFLENSGTHTLMRMRLAHTVISGKEMLVGSQLGRAGILFSLPLLIPANIYLRKMADSPSQVVDDMKDCASKKALKTDTVTIIYPNGSATVPADSNVSVPKPEIPAIVKDSIKLANLMLRRKNTEMKQLVVHEKKITLNVYDNALVDGDTISVFYNGKLLLSHQPLTEKAIVVSLTFDEKVSRHEIILFAENLGSISPNTALIVFNAGGKRYELFASASLTENAVIVFDYKPK